MQFFTLTSKMSFKKSNQKWVKCWMKTPISQVVLHASLFKILHGLFLSKISFKRTHVWLLWNLFQVLTSSLSTATSQIYRSKAFDQFTFVFYKISEWQFLIIFCYTESLFLRHSESDRTHISSRISHYRISTSS